MPEPQGVLIRAHPKGVMDESYVYRLIGAVNDYLSVARPLSCGDPRCKIDVLNRVVEKRLRSVLDEAKVTVEFHREGTK